MAQVDQPACRFRLYIFTGHAHCARPLNHHSEFPHGDRWPAQRDIFAGAHAGAKRELEDVAILTARGRKRGLDFGDREGIRFELHVVCIDAEDLVQLYAIERIILNHVIVDGKFERPAQWYQHLADRACLYVHATYPLAQRHRRQVAHSRLAPLRHEQPVPGSRAAGAQGGFARVGLMIALAVGMAALLSMTGCATTGGAPESPQQVAARVCPALQITGQNLLALDGLDEPAHAALLDAKPLVDAVCSAGAVDVTTLRSLSESALPVLAKVINTAPLPQDQKARLMVSLTVAQIGIAGMLQATGQVAAP